MKVAFFSTKGYDRQYFEPANGGRHEIHFLEPTLNEDTQVLACDMDCICLFVNDKLDASLIRSVAEKGVGLIALRCAGFNNIDIEAAIDAGMKIVRVPAYSPHAVAEHAVSLIMTLNRKTHKAYNRVREGNFSLDRLTGFDMYGRTVGVIGTGQIGRVFAEIMQGFGCKVLAYDLYKNEALEQSGVEYVSIEELLPQCDIVSLHTPLTPDTHHLINEQTLKIMKSGAMLINTSRGALVNTHAAIDALKSRKLGYLGIDVYEQEDQLFFRDLSEQVIEDDIIVRLMTFPNVLITAHQAFFTENALQQIAETTIQNISDFEQGKPLKNEVTKKMIK